MRNSALNRPVFTKGASQEKKSIISGGKGQVVVQRKTIEKDLEAEGGNPHRIW